MTHLFCKCEKLSLTHHTHVGNWPQRHIPITPRLPNKDRWVLGIHYGPIRWDGRRPWTKAISWNDTDTQCASLVSTCSYTNKPKCITYTHMCTHTYNTTHKNKNQKSQYTSKRLVRQKRKRNKQTKQYETKNKFTKHHWVPFVLAICWAWGLSYTAKY